MALDRNHARRQPGQDGRLITRPGTDLELAIGVARRERGRHDCDHVWLRDRLPFSNRHGPVVVRFGTPAGRDEEVARDLAHRRKHALVAHSAGSDLLLDHIETRRGFVHRPDYGALETRPRRRAAGHQRRSAIIPPCRVPIRLRSLRPARRRRRPSGPPPMPTKCCASAVARRCSACMPCGAAPSVATRPTAAAGDSG